MVIDLSLLPSYEDPNFFGAVIERSELRARDVANVLRPLWHEHYEVARKVRDRISKTCTYAVAADYMMANPVDQRVLVTLLGGSSTPDTSEADLKKRS